MLNSCLFDGNSAGLNGGAIYEKDENLITFRSIDFLSNLAIYGSDIGSYPAQAILKAQNQSISMTYQNQSSSFGNNTLF